MSRYFENRRSRHMLLLLLYKPRERISRGLFRVAENLLS